MMDKYVILRPGLDHLFWKFSSLSSLLLKFLFDIPFLCVFRTHVFCCGCDSSINTAAHVVLGKIESSWSEAKSPPSHGDFCLKKGCFARSEWCLGDQSRHTHLQAEFGDGPSYPEWIVIPVYRVGFFVGSVLLLLASHTHVRWGGNCWGYFCWGACLPI